MSDAGRIAEAEGSGETVGEAKWQAVRELERLHPGIDRDRIAFEVVAEGERGLLGVGTRPARVRARADLAAVQESSEPASGDPATALVLEAVERIALALAPSARVAVTEDGEAIRASVTAPPAEIGYVIGRSGRTIDAVQHVVSTVAARALGDGGPRVEVDAGGYRARRHQRLAETAHRAAERVLATGQEVRLAPMTPVERRIVHTELVDVAGVQTFSEGDEPTRAVVVAPSPA